MKPAFFLIQVLVLTFGSTENSKFQTASSSGILFFEFDFFFS
jgi:hypothetical protein